MVNLKVSIPYALDYLAILQVKAGKGLACKEFVDCYNQLQNEIVDLDLIVKRPEYIDLVIINKDMFELLEREYDSDQLDSINKKRFSAKKAIGEALQVEYNEVKSYD